MHLWYSSAFALRKMFISVSFGVPSRTGKYAITRNAFREYVRRIRFGILPIDIYSGYILIRPSRLQCVWSMPSSIGTTVAPRGSLVCSSRTEWKKKNDQNEYVDEYTIFFFFFTCVSHQKSLQWISEYLRVPELKCFSALNTMSFSNNGFEINCCRTARGSRKNNCCGPVHVSNLFVMLNTLLWKG